MPNTVVIGTQWGDEGKAKVIDYLANYCDIVVRFHGGANAGHTVITDTNKFIFHLIPSGIMYPDKICIIGNGVVLDIEQLLNEINELNQKKILIEGRLYISDLAHLVLPFHKFLDNINESAMGNSRIGTTGRGIGPAYSDKASRIGIRVGDLVNWDNFVKKLNYLYELKKKYFSFCNQQFNINLDEILEFYKNSRQIILPLIADTSQYIYDNIKNGKSILFEGAQGTFLDIDHGTYPYVTSSNTIAGAVCTGAGIGPSQIHHVIGIVKAYTTRVGNGPFPTEIKDETGEELRKIGNEYGATTGRPRRCGWFDSVLLRRAIQLNGITRLALTKLDVLNSFNEIKICTHYEINGKKTDIFPTQLDILEKCKPCYEIMPGWKIDISECRKLSDLPENAIKYIKKIQSLCYNINYLIISVGPKRSQTISVEPL